VKLSRKVAAALERRRKAFVGTDPYSKQQHHMPGSQNRKKGASLTRSRRR